MPRVDDRPFPTIGGHRPAVEPWPAVLHIGVERVDVPAYVYDDYTAVYDDPNGAFTYDDVTVWPFDRLELFCQFQGLTITSGEPNDDGVFDASWCEATFDNRDGSLSQYDHTGRLVDYAPGRAFDVWAELDGAGWWLFSGKVTAWRERADGTLEVEAFDAFADLNQPLGEWIPGDHGDRADIRLAKICDDVGFTGPTRFAEGVAQMHNFATVATPLEEMQAVARSDGGVLAVDADGTVIYTGRDWPDGRPDQTVVRQFTDNYCHGPLVTWDAELTTDDGVLATAAVLTNVADQTVTALDIPAIDRYGRRTIEHGDDQWIGTAAGQALANWLIGRQSDAYYRLERFGVYLVDTRQDYWRPLIDLRLGDVITWFHEQATTTGERLVITDHIVQALVHEITPELWVSTVSATRAVGFGYINRYDQTEYTYDDTDPGAVYAY